MMWNWPSQGASSEREPNKNSNPSNNRQHRRHSEPAVTDPSGGLAEPLRHKPGQSARSVATRLAAVTGVYACPFKDSCPV